jgi:cell division protein FtsB
LKYTVDSLNKSVDKLNKAIVGYKNDLYNTAKRCNELERAYKASNDDKAKLVEYYQREIKKLEAENEKLKTDCEKLQHGYNDMIFCGGRSCGKQYKGLVDLFKKIDQKKVDAAYKEAYNTTLPVWQKEFLNQMYGIYKESKEKTELPRTLDINGTVYRKSIQIKDFGEQINKLTVDSLIEKNRAFTRKCVDEWLYKIPTKREEMWENILKLHKTNDVIIEVKKEGVSTFLHEIENRIPEITWASGNKIFEAKGTIKDIYEELKSHNRIYFRLHINNLLSYSSDLNTYLFINLGIVSYLPPMRWDLFKKGRIAVKVNKENYAEYCSRMFSHFDKIGVHAFNYDCKFGYFIFNKDTNYIERILSSDNGDAKEINRHKVIDWEDVR